MDYAAHLLRGPRCELRIKTLHGLVLAQGTRCPEAVAIDAFGRCHTYGELLHDAERAAGVLRGRLPSVADAEMRLVAVHGQPSYALVVGLLATLLAGFSYVPLPVQQPRSRLAEIAADARPALLLSDDPVEFWRGPRSSFDDLLQSARTAPRRALPEVNAEALAYVLYTSGTSGRPKGVPISHQAIANRLSWMRAEHGLGPTDAVLQKTSLGFDVSLVELFGTLASGARLVLTRPGTAEQLDALTAALIDGRITAAALMPLQLRALLEHARAGELSLRRVFTGGEAFGPELVQLFHARLPGAALYNGYGPTEAAVSVTYHRALPGEHGTPPIGRPLPNVDLLLLDEAQEPCESGAVGELWIGGVCLSPGYWRLPEQTRATFVELACDGRPTRFYRSGDLVKLRADGLLEFVGRRDSQIKLRGVRIELEEIERRLQRHPDLAEVAVCVVGEGPSRHLHALLRAAGDAPSIDALRAFAHSELPDAMVPARFTWVDALPQNASGKLDRAGLLRLVEARTPAECAAEPRDDLEAKLIASWCSVLGHTDFSRLQSFFDAGGNSLSVTLLQERLLRCLGFRPSLQELLELPSIERQATAFRERAALARHDDPLAAPSYPLLVFFRGAVTASVTSVLREQLALRGLSALPTTEGGPTVPELQLFRSCGRATTQHAHQLFTAVDHGALVSHGGMVEQRALMQALEAANLSPLPLRDYAFLARGAAGQPSRDLQRQVRRELLQVLRLLRQEAARFGAAPARSSVELACPRLVRLHHNCLLGTIDGYCRARFGGEFHAGLGGEHSLRFQARADAGTCAGTLTREDMPFGELRRRLREQYGVSFARFTFPGEPLPLIESELRAGRPVVIDFDFEFLAYRREYGRKADHHPVLVRGMDWQRRVLLAEEQIAGSVELPFADCLAYWTSCVRSGRPAGFVRSVRSGEPQLLAPAELRWRLLSTLRNLQSPSPERGLRGLKRCLAVLEGRRSRGEVFWLDGIWAFALDVHMLGRLLELGNRQLGGVATVDEVSDIEQLAQRWLDIDLMFESAQLSADPSASAEAARRLAIVAAGEQQLVTTLQTILQRPSLRARPQPVPKGAHGFGLRPSNLRAAGA